MTGQQAGGVLCCWNTSVKHGHAVACSARDALQSAHVVGLDVEWKPNTSGAQNPASLLQVRLTPLPWPQCLQAAPNVVWLLA